MGKEFNVHTHMLEEYYFTVLQNIDIWSPYLKVFKPYFSLDKHRTIPTLHTAQINPYLFWQKQFIAQNLVQ